MPKDNYTRPRIERARLVNPERKPGEATELERRKMADAANKVPQQRRAFQIVHYQYDAPFLYDNFRVELGRPWENATNRLRPDQPEEQWGIMTEQLKSGYVGAEVNQDGVELDVPPHGAITFVEDEPIVEVTVIGSACVQPGYVLLYGEPVVWDYCRSGVKMRAEALWGEHLRWHAWAKGLDESSKHAGLSCAVFRTPPCRKITLMAGSQHVLDGLDFANMRHDAHYAVRHIYVGVQSTTGAQPR